MRNRGEITGKTEFLMKVANRLGRSTPMEQKPYQEHTGIPDSSREETNLLTLLGERFESLSVTYKIVQHEKGSSEEADFFRQALLESEVQSIVIPDHPSWLELQFDPILALEQIEQKEISNLESVEQAHMGVVFPEFAIANTGTLALLSSDIQPRSISLLPPTIFAVLKADQVRYRMGDVFAELNLKQSESPSAIQFITGPSRSADIQNDLTIGVHGPGKVYVMIV